jgi:hypothetical protein
VIAVLVRLQWMQVRGRVVRSIRLLKQPKYLVGFLVGIGWMGLWVGRSIVRTRLSVGMMPRSPLGPEILPLIHRFAALVVTIALPSPWLFPWGRLGLPFRESELTMLLQAPLSRRQVIQYGLLKSELGVLISGLLLPLFVGVGGLGSRLSMGLGTWLLFELWHLNGKWRALFNLRQREIPVGLARARRLAVTVGLVAYYAALAGVIAPFLMQLAEALRGADVRQVTANLSAVTWPPLLAALTAPALWLTAPMFSRGAAAFVVAGAPVLLAILAQREIVLRSKARFEEGALERATKDESRRSPTRRFTRISSRARTRQPFGLDRPGRPEVAIVWKNAVRVSRARWRDVGLVGAALLVAIALLPSAWRLGGVAYDMIAGVGAIPMIIFPLLTGMTWNNDLRADLAHIELVRTWPVPAPRFVLAEVIAPAMLSFAGAVFGAAVVLTSLLAGGAHGTLAGRRSELILLFASYIPIAATLSFFSSALQNLAALFVPAWMALATDRGRGFAAAGQRLLTSAGLGLALLFSLIPGALLAGAAAAIQWWLGIPWSAWAFPLWAVLLAGPQLVLAWLIVRAAGGLWDRLDPSQEILELGR